MKKQYFSPSASVYYLRARQELLAGSPLYNVRDIEEEGENTIGDDSED